MRSAAKSLPEQMTGDDSRDDPTERSPPNLICDFHDHRELGPLLVLGEHIALLSGSEAALWRKAQLIDVGEFRGRLDAALDLVLRFELPALGGHQAEHGRSPLRQQA